MVSMPKSIFGQLSSEKLYDKLDVFIGNPTPTSLAKLENSSLLFEKTAFVKNDFLAISIVNSNMGYYYQKFGIMNQSILSYEKAWSIYEEHTLSNYDIYQSCLLPLSKLYTQQGDFLKAEELLKRCYLYAEKKNDANLLTQISLSISALYNTIGNYTSSIKFLKTALKKTNISNDVKFQLANNLATSFIGLRNYDEAKKILITIVSDKRSENVNSLKSLAYIAIQENNSKLAFDYFFRAENWLKNQSDFSSRELINLQIEKAELYLASGNGSQAQKELQVAIKMMLPSYQGGKLPTKEALFADRNFIRVFDIYAETFTSIKDKLEAYDRSFYVEHLLVLNYTGQETKLIHQTSHKQRSEICIGLLWEAYSKNKELKYFESAFNYAENSKSTVLLNKIYENKSESDYANNQHQKGLYAIREKLTDDLLRVQFKNLGDEKANEIVNQIQKIDREITSIKAVEPQIVNITKIDLVLLKQRLIVDKATLISFFIGKESSYQFTVNANEIRMVRIPDHQKFESEINKFIHYFNNPTAINNDVTNFTLAAFSTFKTLQLNNKGNTPNLVLIPDGILSFLPFESLLTEPATSVSFAEMPFLVKQKSIAYSYNVFDYLEPKKEAVEPRILGVFPVFEGSNLELKYSIDEKDAIKKYFEVADFIEERNATKSNFLVKAESASLLHLSTHAGSGDFIVPAHIQFRDDMLYLPELYSLNMENKTVVLSACETGIGKLQSGEGAISVARAFKYAGASKVLFTLWEVNDKSTSQVMAVFYENLKKTNSVFESNQYSKLAYLSNSGISNLKKSPYYWNSFTYYGAIDSEPEKANYLLWIMIAIGSITMILLFWTIHKKKLVRFNL